MKKTILILAVAAISQTASAQISAGSIFVTGFGSINTMGGQTEVTGGPTTITTEHDKQFSGTFGLGGGYFLTDNIAAGLSLSFTGSKLTPADTSDPTVRSKSFGVGLFGRYYVPITEQFFFHGQLGLGLGTGSSSMEDNDGTTTDGPKRMTTSVGISPGFTFFPAPRWGFDMSVGLLGFTSTKMTSEVGSITSTSKSNSMDVNFDLTAVTFGIQYFIGN
jgi:hypothetical protein